MKPAHILTVAFLIILAAVHALRLLFQWALIINDVTIPMWPSVVAVVILLSLAVALWRESKHTAA